MNPILQKISVFSSLVLAACAVYFHILDPLWNDEIYTLQHFVFKGFRQTVTDYHVPNNHILANILHIFWLKISGISALGQLLDHAWRIRIWSLLLSAGTVWFVFRAGRALQDQSSGWLSVLMLLSGVTFQAYAFQVRGYALGMLASAAMLYCTMLWLQGKTLRGMPWAGLALSSAGLLYTMPSNLYAWVAGMFGILLAQASVARQEGWKRMWSPLTAMLLGGLIAFLCYWPVLGQLLNSEYFEAGKSFQLEHSRQLYRTFLDFLGFRALFLLLFFSGVYFAWKKGGRSRMVMVYLLAALLSPFLLTAIRGDLPPDRVLTVLLPLFSVSIIFMALRTFEKTTQFGAYGLLILTCLVAYGMNMVRVKQILRQNLDAKNHYYPGVNFNYYQHYYNPNAEYDAFQKRFGANQVLILESSEEHDLPVYLQHKKQAFVPLDSIEGYILRRKTMYVSTNYAAAFISEMQKMRPAWRCRYLQPEPRLPRIVICEPE